MVKELYKLTDHLVHGIAVTLIHIEGEQKREAARKSLNRWLNKYKASAHLKLVKEAA